MAEAQTNGIQRLLQHDELLQRIGQRDATALTALYDGTSAVVYAAALRIASNSADAEEITIDVYAYVWQSAGNFDSTRGTVITWLVMLTRSRAIEKLRSRVKSDSNGNHTNGVERLCTEECVSSTSMARGDQSILIENALRQLQPTDQELIRSAFFSGFTHPELAIALDIPLGTVKSRIRTILLKLRDLLH